MSGWAAALSMAVAPAAAQNVTTRQDQRPDGKGDIPRSVLRPRGFASGVVTSGNGIDYHGGPLILGTTHVYYIWYGTWDASSIDILTNLANHIGGSPYFSINTGYFDGNGHSVSNSVSLAASAQDNYSLGKSLSETDIWTIVSNALTGGKLPVDLNGVYFVLTASDVAVSGFPSSQCGWHSYQTYNNQDIKYAFVGNPAPSGLNSCAGQTVSPNGNAGADAMASTIAHELEESVTDPTLDAWYDAQGQENADKCIWTFGSTYTALNGSKANMQLGAKDYLIQTNWVNASGGFCALSYSPGASDFALSVSPSSQTVVRGSVSGTYTVSVVPVNGFSGVVNFTVSGLPNGASASAVTSSGVFTVSTSSAMAGGSYDFTITGTSGFLTHTASATLVVTAPTGSSVVVNVGTISPEPSMAGQAYSVAYTVTSTTGTPAGNVTVSDGSNSCTATVAAGSCKLISSTAGTKTITVSYAGDGQFAPASSTKLHVVTGSGGSMAQIASAGGWETTLALVNLGTSSAQASVNFFGDSGNPLSLPFTFPQNISGPLNASTVSQNINPSALLLLDTNGPSSQPVNVGWANLLASGNINGFALFRYAPSGQESVVPLETRGASSYLLAFDNTSAANPLRTGVAIANLSSQVATVNVTIRDDQGALLSTSSFTLPAQGHTSFMLDDNYPVTAAKRGTVQFDASPGGPISVLGIRANGAAFTTIPVIASGAPNGGSMAHIAAGGGWNTTFTVVNPGSTSADAILSFFDDNGKPLPLPLSFPQAGTTSTAATVTKTLAPGASLLVVTQGEPDAQTAIGSARLTSTGSVSGFAVFNYAPTGQEAASPLETRNARSYVLAFDNTGILRTGLAIASLGTQSAYVNVIVRDDTGGVVQAATLNLAAQGHTAFMLDDVYAVTRGIRGTLEFDTAASNPISVLGIRVNGAAFTSIPVLAK